MPHFSSTADRIANDLLRIADDVAGCNTELLLAELLREPYADRQAELFADLCDDLAGRLHCKTLADDVRDYARGVRDHAKDLEQRRLEAEAEEHRALSTPAGRRAVEMGWL